VHVVTGAFSFTGAYVARVLLDRGERVRTLSRRPDDHHPLAGEVEYAPLQFADEESLARDLEGAATLFNTYWVRYPRGEVTWATVLANTRALLRAARRAGVRRGCKFSVSNASEESPCGCFRAKAVAERELRQSGSPQTHAELVLSVRAGVLRAALLLVDLGVTADCSARCSTACSSFNPGWQGS
jgi:uncharacterized protein YbjT (DUF2867 family)